MNSPERMENIVTRNPKVRTSCDRCYELKERCQRATTSAPCARCERLGLSCLTVRPVRPPGRRAHHGKNPDIGTKPGKRRKLEHCHFGSDRCLDALPDLQSDEKQLLLYLTSQPESLDHFFMYSGFQAGQQQTLVTQLPAVSPLLKNAYIACAMTIKQLRSSSNANMDMSTCVGYISKAMGALRSLRVLTSQDAVLCNTLGGVLSFAIYTAIGVGVPDICSFCLSATDPFMGAPMTDTHEDPWQTFLVLLEVADCLVYRRKPTRTIQMSASAVDRRLGLCVPLLAHYHDLAIISNSLLSITDIGILSRLQKQLDVIHALVESWQPCHLGQLLDQFSSSADIVNLLAQAKVYRLGALLVGHRLRYPFGSEDIQAEIWSKEAMIELEMAKRVTRRPLRFVTLPFIVAAVEVRAENLRSETLRCVDDYVDHYAPFLRDATKIFLLRVWHERDMGLTTRWFDSIHKPCPVMDSIDATCFVRS
ncbi:hypothetical protein BKA61DRAFT_549305 [Leptodontidium sp. MPI-SDFR-AT-0119]|nr:hypothetical protein BKA61DRAFT_549305 [Leptodontidium sp. MPI-SDFR-AT-0119]